jgi:hypothetical protein
MSINTLHKGDSDGNNNNNNNNNNPSVPLQTGHFEAPSLTL